MLINYHFLHGYLDFIISGKYVCEDILNFQVFVLNLFLFYNIHHLWKAIGRKFFLFPWYMVSLNFKNQKIQDVSEI